MSNKEIYNKNRFSQLPWIEKYRPTRTQTLLLSDQIRDKIDSYISNKNIPNMLLTGSPGVGKTSTIRCIALELYGKYYSKYVLEINASDDRGIKSVQNDIISFCKNKLCYAKDDTDKYPTFKLIIMDEADNMIERAQQQINTLMETYMDGIRFAFTSNNSSEIIESIQSKCMIFRYMGLRSEHIVKRLEDICMIEKVSYDKSALKYLSDMSEGDMRNSINMLQLLYNKSGCARMKYIDELCDLPQPYMIRDMFDCIIKCDAKSAFSIANNLRDDGYGGYDIMLGMIHTLKNDICSHIPEDIKIILLEPICMSAYKISKGVDSMLQIIGTIAELILILEAYKS
jgi:replication factor C subunit 2/4